MSSKKWKRASAVLSGHPAMAWSNVETPLPEFLKKNMPPQVVKVKKDASKSAAFKSSIELVLHSTKLLKKVEACVVSEGTKFAIPYDCPAKVYQLTRAEEYTTLSELRQKMPTCRFFLVTRNSNVEQLKDLQRGEVLSIIFKKTVSGSEVFTCERKKLNVKLEIRGNALGGFAAMGTTQERKISDFVRHYSTFPIGIGLAEATLSNKAFHALNDLVSRAESGLIRLTRLFNVDAVIASSLGKRKQIYVIPKSLDLAVSESKSLSKETKEYEEFCKKLNDDVDDKAITTHLTLLIAFNDVENEVVHWCYGDEETYEASPPGGKGTASYPKANGEVAKREGGGNAKEQIRKVSSFDGAKDGKMAKEKASEKDAKDLEKEKSKEKDKSKDKKNKETKSKSSEENPKVEKTKVEKSKGEKAKAEKSNSSKEDEIREPVEDDAGYLVPSELIKAQKENGTDARAEPGAEGKERSSIGVSFGRLMDKVKGKKEGKKGERPSSGIVLQDEKEEKTRKSATLPANSSSAIKKSGLAKNKAKTMESADLTMSASTDDLDGPVASSKEKEAKKKDKRVFGTAGKKAGARLRNALGKSKACDDQNEVSKPSSPVSSSLPPSPDNDDLGDQDMYVTPVDSHIGTSSAPTSMYDRELPELPPEEPRKVSNNALPEIHYNEDDLYDEIFPVEKKTFKIPKDLSKLSTNDISEVLRALNMSEHVPKFRNEQIDGEIFKSLDDRTLGSLGVIDPVQRLKVKKLLKGWRPKN